MTDDARTRGLVSVVLPTYGRPDRLVDAVESVAAQTYEPVELVVVDDCSPEPVAPVVESADLGSLSVRCLRHEENRGANAARNTGIRESSGEFLAFIDDDDAWLPEKLQRQVDSLRSAGPNAGVSVTGQRYVDGRGETTTVTRATVEGDVTEEILRGAHVNPFSCLLVRRDVVEAAGLPDERFPSWQDREWYLRLSQHAEFVAVPEPLVVRRMDGEDRIGRNYVQKRDVSYPLIVEKHRSLAAAYGPSCERQFVGSNARLLASTALSCGYYRDAVKYAVHSLRNDPTSKDGYAVLLAAIGGPLTYGPLRRAKRAVDRLRSSPA